MPFRAFLNTAIAGFTQWVPLPLRFAMFSSMIAVAFAICIWFRPSGGDATGYYMLVESFRNHGLMVDMGSLRTYGYPLLLWGISFLTGLNIAYHAMATSIIQFGGYLLAILWLGRQVRGYSVSWERALYIGTLLNPIILGLVVDRLTESPTLILFALLLGLLLAAAHATTQKAMMGYLLIGATLAAFALMIRPANLSILAVWHVAALAVIAHQPSRRVRLALAYLGAAPVLSLLIWWPQTHYNLVTHGEWRIFPVCRLDNLQFVYGVLLLKLQGHMIGLGPGDAIADNFPNPFVTSAPPHPAWLWYIENPIAGAQTLLLHLFASLDVIGTSIYMYNPKASWRWAFRVGNWAILLMGMSWLWLSLGTLRARALHRTPYFGALLFIILSAGLISGLNMLVAVETRFGMIPLVILWVLAARWVQEYLLPGRVSRKHWLILAIALTSCMALSIQFQRWNGKLSTEIKIASASNFSANGVCYNLNSDNAK